MDFNRICQHEYCGYFEQTEIHVTGVFNNIQYRSIEETSDLNKEEKDQIKTFKPANVKTFATNHDLEKAPLLSFRLIFDVSTNKLSVFEPKIFSNDQPYYPGQQFEKEIKTIKTSYTKPIGLKMISRQDEKDYSAEMYMESFNYGEDLTDIKKYLSTNNTAPAFIENINVVYNTLVKTGETDLCLITVEPDWLHFDDYISHGLLDVWNKAFINSDKNYLLVFQNLNITIPRCGLTPLFDVINHNRPQLPGANKKGIPQNLHIFATLLKDTEPSDLVIPLDLSLFHNWNVLDISNNGTIKVLNEELKNAYLNLYTRKNA